MKITDKELIKAITIEYDLEGKTVYQNGYISRKVSPAMILLKGYVFNNGKEVIHIEEDEITDVVEIENPTKKLLEDIELRKSLLKCAEKKEENKLIRRLENDRLETMERQRSENPQFRLGI